MPEQPVCNRCHKPTSGQALCDACSRPEASGQRSGWEAMRERQRRG